MLHTVNKSSFERNSLQSCLNTIDDTSVILLIEDGVISAAKNANSPMLADLATQGTHCKVMLMREEFHQKLQIISN